jgi:hypothetical protein
MKSFFEQLNAFERLCLFDCSTVHLLKCSIFCQRQKIPPRGVEPLEANPQAPINKALTENKNPVLSTSLDKTMRNYPELGGLVKLWPELPEPVRAEIAAIVKAHTGEKK